MINRARPARTFLIDQARDAIEAIVYQRVSGDEYRDELRVALLVLADGRSLVASMPGVSTHPSARR